MNSITVAAVQPKLRSKDETPLSSTMSMHVIDLLKQAAKRSSIDLFVLPELCPFGYSENTFERYLPNNAVNVKMMKDIHELFCECAKVRC